MDLPTMTFQLTADAVHGLTAGRAVSTTAAVLALAGAVVGWRVLARSHGGTALVAVLLGLSSLSVGVAVATRAEEGLGSGQGLGGAVVATVLGAVAAALGGVALRRARHRPG